jgi:tetratricopeptide (TPR) repeat protein
MKRTITTGLLVLAAGMLGLMAQTAPALGVKSKGEADAVNALMQAANAHNPDGTIKAADDLVTKYADTAFKEVALYLEAASYQQKRDNEKAQIYAERVLDINPKNYQAELLVGEVLAMTTRENDLDKEEKLTRADKLLKDAIANVQIAAKPNPQITDAQWDEGKKQIASQSHNDLGLVALTRKKYDVAVSEFRTAQEMDPQATYQVRLASALQSSGKSDEALAICDKLLADPNLHPAIKAAAENVKKAAMAAKK